MRHDVHYVATIVVVMSGLLFPAEPASAECEVSKDDGRSWIDKTVSNCAEYFSDQHFCGSEKNVNASVCKELRAMVAVDWNGAQDLVISPHRGLWGYHMASGSATDPPKAARPIIDLTIDDSTQNSLAAIRAAHEAGYRFIEIDVVLNWEYGQQTMMDGVVYVTHFLDLYGATNWIGSTEGTASGSGFMQNENSNTIASTELHLRSSLTRQVVNDDLTRLSNISETLDYVRTLSPVPIILIDPKWAKKYRAKEFGTGANICVWFCEEPFFSDVTFYRSQYREMVRKVLAAAANRGMLPNIIVKAPRSMIRASSASVLRHFREVLWAPQPDITTTFDDNIGYLNAWLADRKNIAFIEAVVPDENNWAAKSIMYQGRSFQDLSDYVRGVFDRRFASWVFSEQAQWGNSSSYFPGVLWLGSFPGDRKGQYLWAINQFRWGKHQVITTDHPYIYTQVRGFIDPY